MPRSVRSRDQKPCMARTRPTPTALPRGARGADHASIRQRWDLAPARIGPPKEGQVFLHSRQGLNARSARHEIAGKGERMRFSRRWLQRTRHNRGRGAIANGCRHWSRPRRTLSSKSTADGRGGDRVGHRAGRARDRRPPAVRRAAPAASPGTRGRGPLSRPGGSEGAK